MARQSASALGSNEGSLAFRDSQTHRGQAWTRCFGSITQKGFRVKDLDSNEGQVSLDYSKYQLVEVGDFAMNHMDLITGGVDIAQSRGVTSPDYRVFSIRDHLSTHERYFLYLFQTCLRRRIFFAYGQGSSQLGRWRFPTDNFKNFRFPVPPPVEQGVVAGFLDRETAKIDALVAEQRRLIDLLKEKRQAVISHAVTKGLNPDVLMKPSGVGWLGDVPEHWTVEPFKRQIKRNDGGVWGSDPDGLNDAIVLRSTEQTVDGCWQIEDPAPRKLTESEVDYALLVEGDLLLTKSSGSSLHIGKTTLVTAEIAAMRCCYSNFMQRIRTKASFLPQLAWYAMNNDLVRRQFDLLSNSTTGLANLNSSIIRQIVVPVPPPAEQTQIVAFLDRETAKIDALIAEAQRAIDLLQERRTALISAAVTGQIDVRPTSERTAA